MIIMDKPWYQNFFLRARPPQIESTEARADAGDAEAQFSLGLKCAGGDGADYAQAAQWYVKAADQGHSLAQFKLGLMYSTGQGRPKDEVTANRWFYKAALQGEAAA